MFSPKAFRAARTVTRISLCRPIISVPAQTHAFSATARMTSKFPTPSSDRPQNEMQYFPGMTTALPSESAEFRRVLWTGLYSQLVLMTIPVGGDIGEEIHTVDQVLTFTSGKGLAQVGSKEQEVKAGDMVIVPAGTKHQFLNKGPTPLILYTVYSPAEHKPTTIHKTKEEGDQEEEDGIDVAPEWSQRSKEQNEKEGWVKGE
ncbi:Putative rmlC-like cupin domain superfamily, rmlC-like jelly roll protein [Colletotrichum destructivum]|uniref:RmlC-like cupin domain superfamily, rmlC-like jelly roll protein n=2 Tax=Colletotrichum destructivum species complex TaxID=2707350 RepID=A0AAX4IBC4_9PEZI|nr:Putative rmlC-like cupin domain superfamily, rmlC-like jelly roll protein [Colletotrichum destructivum]